MTDPLPNLVAAFLAGIAIAFIGFLFTYFVSPKTHNKSRMARGLALIGFCCPLLGVALILAVSVKELLL